MTLKDHQILNRKVWQGLAEKYEEPAEIAWRSGDPKWGIWQVPDSKLNLLPTDLSGFRCIELGSGAGYVSSWMARRGGEVFGIDPTPKQLETARRLEEDLQLGVEFVEGFAECLPFADATFDFGRSTGKA